MSEPGYRFHRVAATSEIREGEGLRVKLDQWEIAVFNIDGEFYYPRCGTHAFALLSEGFVEGDIVECPLHGGRFEIKTGKAVPATPCTIDLRTYVVRREDDLVPSGIPAAD